MNKKTIHALEGKFFSNYPFNFINYPWRHYSRFVIHEYPNCIYISEIDFFEKDAGSYRFGALLKYIIDINTLEKIL